MLNSTVGPDAVEIRKSIAWQPHGRCFFIHNQEEFSKSILPKWFPRLKYPSFQRQLHKHGFRRLHSQGPDKGAYYHEHFQCGKVELVHKIHPVKGRGKRGRKPQATEPNFHSSPEGSPKSQATTGDERSVSDFTLKANNSSESPQQKSDQLASNDISIRETTARSFADQLSELRGSSSVDMFSASAAAPRMFQTAQQGQLPTDLGFPTVPAPPTASRSESISYLLNAPLPQLRAGNSISFLDAPLPALGSNSLSLASASLPNAPIQFDDNNSMYQHGSIGNNNVARLPLSFTHTSSLQGSALRNVQESALRSLSTVEEDQSLIAQLMSSANATDNNIPRAMSQQQQELEMALMPRPLREDVPTQQQQQGQQHQPQYSEQELQELIHRHAQQLQLQLENMRQLEQQLQQQINKRQRDGDDEDPRSKRMRRDSSDWF
ncbi:transcription factor [Seminavis robusta]|uniref:Transcription factor n=1 Tax=Seminavis robusta TaxID=568900 RepID=A0A9N8HGF8_9STRA|nr:transcription factor [Seminavis robusta]|eukprot:Sro482_g151900.1 transcription factor (435) ;mRNA; f:56658-58144